VRLPLVVVLALVALASSGAAQAAPGLRVGIDDDTVKWLRKPDALVAIDRDLGVDAVRVAIPWRRGRTRPTKVVGTYLHRVALMMKLGQPVVLAVYGRPEYAPVDARGRAQYCGFLAHVAARLPVRELVIWNEANNPRFWPRSTGAEGYEALLARCWDDLHRLHRRVRVISSTAARYDALGFVAGVARAYRASGRTRPIVDIFGHNPYPEHSAEAPSTRHESTVVGQGDLDRLLTTLSWGFAGTAQPVPGPDCPRLWYLEDGFQSAVPAAKRRSYAGRETDLFALPFGTDAALDQGRQLHDALVLAYCQPAVGAFFNFELRDQHRLSGWQSGLLWSDGTRKPSYETFKATLRELRAHDVDCAGIS
jgi:hypothetical protein